MPRTAHIDVAESEKPSPGENFIISLQENSELLGQLENGRTFRFTAPSDAERRYQQDVRTLTVVDLDLNAADGKEPRLVGSLTYTD
jgi:hypothetical protein